jgi:hypothetical protein
MWGSHPEFVAARDRLVRALVGPTLRFKALGHVVFLCGADKSVRREALKSYLVNNNEPQVEVFYAEDVWLQLVSHPGTTAIGAPNSALELERQLAQFSDAVIIIVESPGTFAELGAFSIADDLRAKLLPILDEKYQHATSFLNTGPVRWVNSDSRFGPAVYADFQRFLLAADEIRGRLGRLPPPKSELITSLAAKRKHLLFFVIDLVTIMGPATRGMLQSVLDRTGTTVASHDLGMLLMVACAVGYIGYHEDHGSAERYYYRCRHGLSQPAFATRKYLNIGKERASFASALLRIPAAASMLAKCR